MKLNHKQKVKLARKMLSRVERKKVNLAPLVNAMKTSFISHLFSSANWNARKQARTSKK